VEVEERKLVQLVQGRNQKAKFEKKLLNYLF
jgi:hypothetical protein